jgi:hypothetical protein
MALLLVSSPLPAQEQTQGVQASADKTKKPIRTITAINRGLILERYGLFFPCYAT